MYDIVGKRNWYFALSAILTLPGLLFNGFAALITVWALMAGIIMWRHTASRTHDALQPLAT